MEGIMSLVNATEYAGLQIKEWNIVQFSKLSSILAEVAREYKGKDLSWDKFSLALSETSGSGMLDLSQGIMDVLEPFTKHAPTILCVSCNVKADRLENMAFTEGIVALLLILKMNMEHLTRFFSSLTGTTNSEPVKTDLTLS